MSKRVAEKIAAGLRDAIAGRVRRAEKMERMPGNPFPRDSRWGRELDERHTHEKAKEAATDAV